jgi:hypothetical protein
MSNPIFSRRAFTLGALAATTGVTACGNGVGGTGAQQIDARVAATVNEMYRRYPNTIPLAKRSSGMLVMPLVTRLTIIPWSRDRVACKLAHSNTPMCCFS